MCGGLKTNRIALVQSLVELTFKFHESRIPILILQYWLLKPTILTWKKICILH